jgi:hypothetical protein
MGPPAISFPSAPSAHWYGDRLAPKVPVLLAQLASFEAGLPAFRDRKANFAQVPFSLGGMTHAFFEFVRAQRDMIERSPPSEGTTLVLSPDQSAPLAYALDAFLDHARRVSDAVLFLVSARHRISLPSSMPDVVARLRARSSLLPNERALILAYWEQYGLRVKEYRDLAQHHALLTSDCRVFRSVNGEPSVYLAIPNNPSVKSVSKLSFENPTVHAFLFMRRVLYDTIEFVNRLSILLLDGNLPTNVASVGPNIRTWLGGARQEGVRVATVEEMSAGIEKLMTTLASPAGGEAV